MAISDVTDASFKDVVESAQTVLVDFWANWCPPCKMIAPVLEELDIEIPGLKIVKLNVDDDPITPGSFNVMSLPTLIVFKNGQAVDRIVGFKSKNQLQTLVSRYL
ncbi:thioredoxin [Paenibacillus beijingensis]|uniref:Thioredoxin n=1 Tax=Paenibacillus beijingensis TaxID=1126833 RepID=A0A0D5NQK5_9BACL|nr:thioredoxin [Paenibacillus beijingensis]AJY77551.1 thioredoxin [Paenibacillus beijingensis]